MYTEVLSTRCRDGTTKNKKQKTKRLQREEPPGNASGQGSVTSFTRLYPDGSSGPLARKEIGAYVAGWADTITCLIIAGGTAETTSGLPLVLCQPTYGHVSRRFRFEGKQFILRKRSQN
ncbi:hypothetical protein A3F34_01205 [Candidatus Roizmanbacteria bacterium RIFCSPHIGHO2_12_FULL_44_10]|uniref:Uncharacterized protein n=1 Tax=Candidatus Roizmanbacteria bacterium RIFCSPHIGHO2_12_FULL_44_10 TaxID=1802054 RepID=A0A1F7I5S4_9BACT|nr:MAG: hypothetical protein A3F34_01205 [Candidatus Roizmanbacteria bacterium RIFCSPHIGHO2_12_FULL_44_10]